MLRPMINYEKVFLGLDANLNLRMINIFLKNGFLSYFGMYHICIKNACVSVEYSQNVFFLFGANQAYILRLNLSLLAKAIAVYLLEFHLILGPLQFFKFSNTKKKHTSLFSSYGPNAPVHMQSYHIDNLISRSALTLNYSSSQAEKKKSSFYL